MKKSRPKFILVCWAALAAAAQAQSPQRVAGQGGPATPGAQSSASTDGQALVERVEQRLEQFSSLSAKVRMQIELFDQQASGAGLYSQKRDGSRTLSRLSLKSQFHDTAFALLQVNDGRRFWTYCELPDGPSLNKLDLERIGEQSRNRGTPGSSLPPVGGLPIGGLPKLLAGLRQNFQFSQLGETRLGDRRVVAIDGSWRPDRLAAAVPDQRSAIEAGRPLDLKKLPARLPGRVVLYIGQSDLMLYRIDYLRRNDRASGAGQGSALPGNREMVTIEFFDIRVNQPIDSQEFQYQPPKGVKVIDATDGYLKSLGAAGK
jgi:hypothetical protein